MRMTIIKPDNVIVINQEAYFVDLSEFDDMSWIEGYDRATWGRFHALQWYGDPDEDGFYGFGKSEPYGEIEFRNPVPNVIISELGFFEKAVPIWEAAKLAEEERIRQEEAERLRLQEEEEAKLRETYLDFDLETLLADL